MSVTKKDIQALYEPLRDSHKGQNGRLLVIGGSELFHAASMWALEVASKIVDLVHYASIPENNEIVKKAKERFHNGIVVRRQDVEEYIKEDDCIVIGPGMIRSDASHIQNSKFPLAKLRADKIKHLEEIGKIQDEGVQTEVLTNYLLKKYPEKQWVIDAGSLQMMDVDAIPKHAILTPHQGELGVLWDKIQNLQNNTIEKRKDISLQKKAQYIAKKYSCIVLVKGAEDIVCAKDTCDVIQGGNVGLTKGGTGDVLAGLIGALACNNDPFLAARVGSFINKKAADDLYKTVGRFYNASDLVGQIPKTLHEATSL